MMISKLFLVSIGTWFIFMILAVGNAGLRNIVFKQMVGALRAHQLSTVIFIILIFTVTYVVFNFSNISMTNQEAVLIGLFWVLLTICFEFIAGHYVFGNSWDALITDYNIVQGRMWIFVLIALFFSPMVVNKL